MNIKTLTSAFSSLLLVTIISQLGTSCPCHTKRAVATSQSNASVAVVQVSGGIRAINRLVGSTIVRNVPKEVYDVDNETRSDQEMMATLAKMQQYVTLITTLQSSGMNSTELELYRLLLHAILKDSCEWLNAYKGIAIDCSDNLEHFIPVVLSFGLHRELKNLECYLKGFPTTGKSLTPDKWVESTIQPVDPENIRCEFCTRVNLHCPSCTTDSM